jgi:hypothetical protein
MPVTAMEIRHNETAECPLFPVDFGLRGALATYARLRWPVGTAKMAAREWDLTLDEAKGLVARRTSVNTLDKLFTNKNFLTRALVPVIGAVAANATEKCITDDKQRRSREAAAYATQFDELGQMAADLGALIGLGARGRS